MLNLRLWTYIFIIA